MVVMTDKTTEVGQITTVVMIETGETMVEMTHEVHLQEIPGVHLPEIPEVHLLEIQEVHHLETTVTQEVLIQEIDTQIHEADLPIPDVIDPDHL